MNQPTETQHLEIRRASGTGLRVVFERLGDRWAHAIECLAGKEWERLLESVEEGAANAWPTSPPLQQLHFEDRADGLRVALAVGMAGRSHWSASIEADSTAGEIRFDIACRASTQPAFVGTNYRFLTPITCQDEGDERREIRLLSASGNGAACVRPASACLYAFPDGTLVVTPGKVLSTFPATVRWQYSIILEPSA